ncbi:MAG: peptidoglycan DD-metalloendopeptidase family protein [Candidatus Pacebacteria bacterium]|jgi:LysM repeat protein|nr:peptidoglycan DD-metalloendopeptidase family protein [Candidatus Paceibacterota bacterium]MDD5013390.1 peptidoglycan DD-metalloendopeptidase family protein [Candidatus Paceibacterota bacterium]MDD5752673.1 peptidoglycan DD-metalloendopeptidase family protein [Candidatus Paceibacterota bacterium]
MKSRLIPIKETIKSLIKHPNGLVFCFIVIVFFLVIKTDNKVMELSQANLINIDSSLQPITSIVSGENNVLSAISSPLFISNNTLGAMMEPEKNNSIIVYTVSSGETINQIAEKFNITTETIMLVNELTSSKIKKGDKLTILPINGLIHLVEKNETVAKIAKKYSANQNDIIEFNNLGDSGNVFVGDILIIPYGKMPKPSSQGVNVAVPQITMPNSYFIAPTTGIVTQGPHFSHTVNGVKQYNSIDIANSLGTPIVAAAGGQIQIVKTIWPNGNYITIAHPNGVVTLYAHLNSFAKDVYPGKQVSQGEIIGYMGSTGNSTGPHLHFHVVGAYNPFLKYPVGTKITY